MSQPFVSTPSNHTKEQSNPRSDSTDVNLAEVITDVVPLSMVSGHTNPIREPRKTNSIKGKPSKVITFSSPSMVSHDVKILEPSTVVKKPLSMTSMYLDPINVEPNVDASAKRFVIRKVMGNVETSENTNKPRFVTTVSKSSMIVADRDDIDKNICVLISQVLIHPVPRETVFNSVIHLSLPRASLLRRSLIVAENRQRRKLVNVGVWVFQAATWLAVSLKKVVYGWFQPVVGSGSDVETDDDFVPFPCSFFVFF
ncbi:hypothetical protein KIW84_043151 [Lathyrus oleraceus]|uniref:Uncharacterized protein n=1 Tax=Pisum sativum TaxID=3888 RepID=A0A9D4XD25_PEA|nr:hypothetical protein KIW84_043151 [Pisum sativum]